MTTGTIFNIQRFSTHDGPGIRTVVFLKGCPLRCYWCQNPESQRAAPELLQKRELCVGCGACELRCPTGAIRVLEGLSTLDRERCTGCGACAEVCPAEALTLSGRRASVDEVLEEILKDRAYYRNSGGGVTLSGGEATAQAEFALAILAACKQKYLHTAIETCGFVQPETLRRFVPLTDLFLYDIKTVKAEDHRWATGQDNALILQNAALLLREGCRVRFRMPLIPDFNDSEADVLALRRFVVDELGASPGQIELLKYNSLGEVKYARLGRENMPCMRAQSDEVFDRLRALL